MADRKLTLDANRFPEPDRAYRMIIEAHRGLSDADSAALNARLVLLLANELGDTERLAQALALARATLPGGPAS